MSTGEDLRAYRFALDLTPAQQSLAAQHAGAARWAYNHALAAKYAALDERRAAITAATAAGADAKAAAAAAPKIPTKPTIQKALNQAKGDERTGADGLCPWWWRVSTFAFQSAFADADTAWKNWVDSITGKRAGRRIRGPRFKTKHRTRDSFRIHHNVTKPTIRLDDGSRRIIVPRLGSLRVHDSTKRLRRALTSGAIIQSITIARGGHRWYASILVKSETTEAHPTRRQTTAGTIGVDIGVHHLAALSDGTIIDNPRHLKKARARLTKAQRALSRTEKGSNRRRRAAAHVGRRHHEIAERRATTLHTLTKQLATGWSTVAIEDLNVAGMTRTAKGTIDNPGVNVRAKAGLNAAILDVSPGERRRQLTYKTRWYGSAIALCDRWYPSSQTCSTCGAKTKLRLSDRVFTCAACGLGPIDRDTNAALNIAANAVIVAPGRGETRNARRADTDTSLQVRATSMSTLRREDHIPGVATSAEQSTDHQKADQRPLPLVS